MPTETNNIIPPPMTTFVNGDGDPLAGGSVFTFDADGTTPKLTYQDFYSNIPNPNPVELDSAGRARILGQGQYVFTVQDSAGNVQYSFPTQDPVASVGISPVMLPIVQAPTLDAARTLLGAQSSGVGVLPWGVCLPCAAPNAPTGWVFCFGQELSRADNPNLFGALGGSWGVGNGSTTFNIPDLRGRVWAGYDAMGGAAAGRLTTNAAGYNETPSFGTSGGSEFILSHSHGVTDPGHIHTVSDQTVNLDNGVSPQLVLGLSGTVNTSPTLTGVTIQNAGTGASGNVQPTTLGNWIIALG